jgi:protein tyrosine/serine phosphatase
MLIYLEGPKKPPLIPPFRYGIVELGIFRGGYPKENNFSFMLKYFFISLTHRHRLKLNTILSLTPEPLNPTVSEFCSKENIEMVHIKVEKPKDTIPLTKAIVYQALQVLLSEKHPTYIHCLDGANVTGIIIMCLRKLQLWSSHVSMAEFTRFTRDGLISTEETEFIEKFAQPGNSVVLTISITLLSKDELMTNGSDDFIVNVPPHASNAPELVLPETVFKWLWNGRIPASFLRGIIFNAGAPYSTHVISCHLTYGHPFVRVRFTSTQIQTLLQYDKSAVLALFHGVHTPTTKTMFPFNRSSAGSREDLGESPNVSKPVDAPGGNSSQQEKGKKTESQTSETDVSLMLKALALEGM